ncbi:MAG: GDSL-type esterase/lipase family protein [Bacteroidota bacterium]
MPPPLRYLALGDSYTIGEEVEASERWPAQLCTYLEARGLAVSAPVYVASSGWTTDELADAVAASALMAPFDLVTLLIGVNNQYRGRSADEYRPQCAGLIEEAMALAGHRPQRVLLVSIPDYGATPHGQRRDPTQIAEQLEAFNAINRRLATAYGTAYADVFALSQRARADPELVASDGLHPSGLMYTQWVAEAIGPAVWALLEAAGVQAPGPGD